ncbi:hypothetical protein [Mycobacterium paragordonae]
MGQGDNDSIGCSIMVDDVVNAQARSTPAPAAW